MNAVTAFTREDEVQSKIRKVSTFSRYARIVCSALFGFGLVGGVFMLVVGVLGALSPKLGMDPSLTPEQKLWMLPMSALMIGLWLGAIYQFYRLFGNLAAGSIYTAENVRRLRQIGLLWMTSAVFGILIPVLWAAFVRMGLLEPLDLSRHVQWFKWIDPLNSLVSAGIILLISWVMDVGLYEKDHAAELQRDADLVI